MPLTFPSSPAVNQTTTQNGRVYRWSGFAWEFDSFTTAADDARWSLFLPPAPTGVTASAGNGQATVSWTAPSVLSQTPITDYVVQYSSNSGSTWTTFADGTSTSTSATVTGLTNGTAYTFRVAAVNGVGTGAYSAASSAVTPASIEVPQTITGLQLWLDASDASTLYDATSGGSLVAADGAVARWEDKSGNARHATQATSGSRPLRKTAIQGGKDVLRFNASSQQSLTAGTTSTWNFLHDGTASYVVVVLKAGTTSDPNALMSIIDTGGVSGDQVGIFLGYDDRAAASQNNSVFVSVSANSNAGYQSFARDSDKLTASAFSVLEVLVSPTAAAGSRLRSRVNGGTQFGSNTDTISASTASSTNPLYIGKTDAGSSFGFNGDICEILLYSQQPTSAEQTALREYLATKWGITLA